MEVRFRDIDPFSCWIWVRFANPPGRGEREYLETLLDSWFFLGKLGAFNAEALQVHEEGVDLSWMAYDNDDASRAQPALMHAMGQPQYQGSWARCWMDLGTSDGVGLDLLINGLRQLDHEFFEIEEVLIGGVNDDWPVEEDDEDDRFLPLMDQLDRLAEQESDAEDDGDDADDSDEEGEDDDSDYRAEGGQGSNGSDSRADGEDDEPSDEDADDDDDEQDQDQQAGLDSARVSNSVRSRRRDRTSPSASPSPGGDGGRAAGDPPPAADANADLQGRPGHGDRPANGSHRPRRSR